MEKLEKKAKADALKEGPYSDRRQKIREDWARHIIATAKDMRLFRKELDEDTLHRGLDQESASDMWWARIVQKASAVK